MSFPYSSFFATVGSVLKSLTTFNTYQAALLPSATLAQNIITATSATPTIAPNVSNQFSGFTNSVAGWETSLVGIVNNEIASVQNALNAPSSAPSVILPLLAQQMVIDSQTIQANIIAAPVVALGAGDVGNGTLVADITTYTGAQNETIINQVVRFQCIQDQYTGGTAGGENFSTTGYALTQPQTYGTAGNGNGPSLTVANNSPSQMIRNGSFTTFTVANTPDNWTIGAGTVGTNIFSSNTIHSPDVHSLLLQGNSSAATVTLTQPLTQSLQVRTKYGFGAWLRKGAGSFAGGSNLKISIYSPTGAMVESTIFNADPTTLTTGYLLHNESLNIGTTLASDATVRITWTGAGSVANTGQIFIDDMAVVPLTVFGGVGYVIFRGTVDFLQNDFITNTTAISSAGVFQSFFTSWFGIALPSALSSPSISDSLA